MEGAKQPRGPKAQARLEKGVGRRSNSLWNEGGWQVQREVGWEGAAPDEIPISRSKERL